MAAAVSPPLAASAAAAAAAAAADAALLLRHCARAESASPSTAAAPGTEALVWWRAPVGDDTPEHACLETSYHELLLCLATLRETATVSGLRAAVAQACTPLVGAGECSTDEVRAFVRGGGGSSTTTTARWATAATLVYACAALRVRLCVIDYTQQQPVPEAHWIEAPSCGDVACTCMSGSTAGVEAAALGEDDIACLARLEDGHWGVLARDDDAVRTFTREAELPFALALAHATIGRREHAPMPTVPSPGY